MICPTCALDMMSVRETRKHEGAIYRRRECFNLHTWWTCEESLAELPMDVRQALKAAVKARQVAVV